MLSGVGAELGKDRSKGVDMRELNNTEKFTSQVLHVCVKFSAAIFVYGNLSTVCLLDFGRVLLQ